MARPNTREEALARGFKPVHDLDALIREMTGKSADDYFREQEELVGPIDCNDPTNGGKMCRTIPGNDGTVIILYCTRGACSRSSAVVGADD